MNRAFADVVAEAAPEDAAVLVQDYHLALMALFLADRRPDLRLVHFSHTPFANPDSGGCCPPTWAASCWPAWPPTTPAASTPHAGPTASRACCAEQLGDEPTTFVAPLAPDAADIGRVGRGRGLRRRPRRARRHCRRPALLVRVDRIELSKNILRGFRAFEDLLERYPEWRERVVFGAFVYPSREGLPEYLAYRQEVEATVRRINERWATPGWTPILFDPSDDFPRSVAALRRADVLLINPIRDGLNLVAEEGPLVNDRDAHAAAVPRGRGVGPARRRRPPGAPLRHQRHGRRARCGPGRPARGAAGEAAELRRRAAARTPDDWLADQLAAAD